MQATTPVDTLPLCAGGQDSFLRKEGVLLNQALVQAALAHRLAGGLDPVMSSTPVDSQLLCTGGRGFFLRKEGVLLNQALGQASMLVDHCFCAQAGGASSCARRACC